MDFLKEEIAEYVEIIWDKTLGIAVYPDDSAIDSDCGKEPSYSGIVQIAGDWSGAISIELQRDFAIRAASAMFQMTPEQVGEEDLLDTVSELSNIVAGNIKSVLPGESVLMIPIVAVAQAPSISMAEADLVSNVGFASEGHVAKVKIHQKRG
ncbi:MAG: chemotaxis protein CheX [Myxococcota bacterium]